MPVYKDDGNGTFYVQCYYRDARGSKRHKTKRGFSSEVEAAVWESQFKSLNGGAMDMTFSEFVEVYASEVKPRIREHTWITKEYIINDKLVPFFGDMRMSPKNGTSLSLMMYSLVIHVCSRMRGFTSEAYTSTNSENVMSMAPPLRLLNWLSHTAASTSEEKPRFVLWRFEPRASR